MQNLSYPSSLETFRPDNPQSEPVDFFYSLIHSMARVASLFGVFQPLTIRVRLAAKWGHLASGNYLSTTMRCPNLGALHLGKGITIEDDNELLAYGAVDGSDRDGAIEIGNKSTLFSGSTFRAAGGQIKIGMKTLIGNHCHFGAFGEGITIGDNVLIASHCNMVDTQHLFSSLGQPIADQGFSSRGIVIEDDVWLGAGVTIMDGVTIGTGSIIGAGSVVTKSIPPFSVAVGTPAKVIKTRE